MLGTRVLPQHSGLEWGEGICILALPLWGNVTTNFPNLFDLVSTDAEREYSFSLSLLRRLEMRL